MSRGLVLVAIFLVLAGCGSGGGKAKTSPRALSAGIRFASADFKPGGTLPRETTCDGAGRKPALRITAVPKGTKALLLIEHDPDAPSGDFTHWTVYDIPPGARTPTGTEGLNQLGKPGYAPACPPPGEKPHHYVFDLYALRARTGLAAGAAPGAVRAAVAKLAFARGELVATYGR